LSREDTIRALQGPVRAEKVSFEEKAIEEIYTLTQGYPYFLQEWGYQSWNQASGSIITADVIQRANKDVVKRLDDNFFRVRFARLTPGEGKFLRAMAEIGASGIYRIADVAEALGSDIGKLGPVRARIIKKGMIYSPAHGEIAFTVPLFSDFMRRAMPNF